MIAAETVPVAVAGAGRVGATFAYTLLRSGLASDIVLVDADRACAEGAATLTTPSRMGGPRASTLAVWMPARVPTWWS